MDASNASGNYAADFSTDFGLHDFINDANFDHFIDLIKGETADPIVSFNRDEYDGCELINGCLVDNNQFGPTPADLFEFNSSNSFLTSLPSLDVEKMGGEEEEEEDSYATTTTTTTTPTKRTKGDRSKTLVSERRRRGRMKDKLYALRSLVPNITKMDKASIVGDAVLYVQDLQMQAKKLRAEIAGLESSIKQGEETHQGSVGKPKEFQVGRNNVPICRKIVQMEVFQVEERGFYVRLVCNKGQGVAVSLYRALESLVGFNVQTSNLTTVSEKFIVTFTLNVKECGEGMNLPNLKLWVTGALLNQGFEFKSST
ncbi:hypothetical protein L1049_013061 [Liquidambar formosana]|uniref:BHLH domain-containing protein n=1 Tax=Liquidambar formosana TaxID=63359 RepID=A0AAP0WTZ0_LIQFO